MAYIGGQSIDQWYREIPVYTKIFTTTALVSTLSMTFGLLNPASLVLIWPRIIEKFEIWRLFTNFIFIGAKIDINFIFSVMIFYNSFIRYEQDPFPTGSNNRSADFLFALLFLCVCFYLSSLYFNLYVLERCLTYGLIYLTSRRSPNAMSSMYGVQFKLLYLPWIYLLFDLVFGNPLTSGLIGIFTGHVFYFLVAILPQTHNINLIKCPQFCITISNYINSKIGVVESTGGGAGFTATPPRQRGAEGMAAPGEVRRRFVGRGNVLGTQ